MQKKTLGRNLLIVYAFLIIIFTFRSGFRIFSGVDTASLPTLYLFLNIPFINSFFISLVSVLGLEGLIILRGIIQGLILYYGGNWLEKVLNKNK